MNDDRVQRRWVGKGKCVPGSFPHLVDLGTRLHEDEQAAEGRPTTMSDTEDNSPPFLMRSNTSPIIQKK